MSPHSPQPPRNASQEKTRLQLARLRKKIKAEGIRPATKRALLKSKQILLEELYNPPEGSIYFYAQDEEGFPIHRIRNSGSASRDAIYPLLQLSNTFDTKDWPKGAPRPPGYREKWPPATAKGLQGDMMYDPLCIYGCEELCEHKYSDWVIEQKTVWVQDFSIQTTKKTGYGVFAEHDMSRGMIAGEYTGALKRDDPANESDYLAHLSIGQWTDADQAYCMVDAMYAGSVFRFMNSSCKPNAELDEIAVGVDCRIAIVRIIRDIKKGEELCISYGSGYFNQGFRCRCGEDNCQFPDAAATAKTKTKTEMEVRKTITAPSPKISTVQKGPTKRRTPAQSENTVQDNHPRDKHRLPNRAGTNQSSSFAKQAPRSNIKPLESSGTNHPSSSGNRGPREDRKRKASTSVAVEDESLDDPLVSNPKGRAKQERSLRKPVSKRPKR